MPKIKKAYSEIDDIREDLDSLKNNVVELTRHLKKEGKKEAAEIKDIAMDRLEEIKTSGRRQLKSVERRVKQKPAESVAIAFAAGIVASFLFGRR